MNTFKGPLSRAFTATSKSGGGNLGSYNKLWSFPSGQLLPFSSKTPSLTSFALLLIPSWNSIYTQASSSGEALSDQSGFPKLLRHLPPERYVKGNPSQPRGLEECSVSGQLFGRHPAATVPKGGELGGGRAPPRTSWERSSSRAARSSRRRAGRVSPSLERGRVGDGAGEAGT